MHRLLVSGRSGHQLLAVVVGAIEQVAEALTMADPLTARAIDLLASEANRQRSAGRKPVSKKPESGGPEANPAGPED